MHFPSTSSVQFQAAPGKNTPRSTASRKAARSGLCLLGTLLLGAVTSTSSAHADMLRYNVSFNPSNYSFDPATTYGLDFLLSGGGGNTRVIGDSFSGSGTGPANNFTLSNAAGDATTTSAFSPVTGGSLNFQIDADFAPGSTDTFSFGIRKGYSSNNPGTLIPTTEPAVFESFFKVDFSNPGNPLAFSSNDSNPNIRIGAPSFTVSPVPEPSTWAMMLLGTLAMGLVMRRKREGESDTA